MKSSVDTPILLGRNINTVHGFVTSADYAHKTGSNVFQIFLKSPQAGKDTRRNVHELLELKRCIKKNKQKIVIHGSFLLNFCNPPESVKHANAVNNLANDLNDSDVLGAIGVIIHMGHNTKALKLTTEQAVANYVEGVRSALQKSVNSSVLILETGAGQGDEICTSLFELGALRNRFSETERQRIKFCIDTCHIFASGYDVGNTKYVALLNSLIDTCLGWENVVAVHVNDSEFPLNCRKDRHADIGKGLIGLDGLMLFLEICAKRGVPMFLETPCNTMCADKSVYTHEKQIKVIKERLSIFDEHDTINKG